MGGRWPGPGAGIQHEAAGMSRSGCAGKSWGPRPDPPSAAGRTRIPQGPPAPLAGTRDPGAPRHPSLQGQGYVASHRDTVGIGCTGGASGGLCARLCGGTRDDPLPGPPHSEVTPAMAALSQGYPIQELSHPWIRTGGSLGSPSPGCSLWECIAHCREGWNHVLQGEIQAHGALIKGMPYHREQIPPGCPGRVSSRPGTDPTWAIRCVGRGEADPGIRGQGESLGRRVPLGTGRRFPPRDPSGSHVSRVTPSGSLVVEAARIPRNGGRRSRGTRGRRRRRG